MGKRSFFYEWPRIYKAGLWLIHGGNLARRYSYLSDRVGESVTVQEPACGPALLAEYLDKSCIYRGFDINEKFVKSAQKKGLDVKLGNAENIKSYSKSDVVVLCDSLHHIGPQHELQVLDYSLNSAEHRLIICDPFKDQYLTMLPNWLPGAQRLLYGWYDYVEKDGNNQVRLSSIRTRRELSELMMEGFGLVPREVRRDLKEIGEDLIVTYYL